jgi:hypothetical protein
MSSAVSEYSSSTSPTSTPTCSQKRFAMRVAMSIVFVVCAAPDCGIAFVKSPFADGVAMSVPTLIPPADSPKIVTLDGSPPKFAMLSRTHSSAAT